MTGGPADRRETALLSLVTVVQVSASSSRPQRTEDSSMDVNPSGAMSRAGESLVGSDIGSPGCQRELGSAVDLGQGIGMPGYVGKMSDIPWMQRVQQHLVGVHSVAEPDVGLSKIDNQALEPQPSATSPKTTTYLLLMVSMVVHEDMFSVSEKALSIQFDPLFLYWTSSLGSSNGHYHSF